jgi:hypothetical protein
VDLRIECAAQAGAHAHETEGVALGAWRRGVGGGARGRREGSWREGGFNGG